MLRDRQIVLPSLARSYAQLNVFVRGTQERIENLEQFLDPQAKLLRPEMVTVGTAARKPLLSY